MLKQIAGDCIAVRLRILNRIVTTMFDKALRPYGIRASQLNIIVAVSAYGPSTVHQLCRVLHMDASTLSRSIARMKKKGWLESEPSGDGKIMLIRTTPLGLDMIRTVYQAWEEAQEKAAALLGDPAVEAISSAGNKRLLEGMAG